MRFRKPIRIALLALFCLPLIGADEARFDKLGHELMCLCGCKQVLLECNHVGCSYSDRMREELSTALTRGDSDSLTLQSFVQKYGATVLAAPTKTGFNRVAWIMPYAALGGGLLLVTGIVKVWRQRTTMAYASPERLTSAQLDALRQRARQETEI